MFHVVDDVDLLGKHMVPLVNFIPFVLIPEFDVAEVICCSPNEVEFAVGSLDQSLYSRRVFVVRKISFVDRSQGAGHSVELFLVGGQKVQKVDEGLRASLAFPEEVKLGGADKLIDSLARGGVADGLRPQRLQQGVNLGVAAIF